MVGMIEGQTILEMVMNTDTDKKIEKHHAEKTLSGLGFSQSDLQRDLSEFSGGRQMRVLLAKVLARDNDLMLLDEPTNHLDQPSRIWLIDYLYHSQKTFIVISHDLEFLDSFITHTWVLDHKKIKSFAGNSKKAMNTIERDRILLENQRKDQLKEQEKILTFISRFRAKATKAKQVQSRLKQLEKIEIVSLEQQKKNLRFSFPQPEPSGKLALTLENISKSYGQLKVFNNISITISRNEKIALVGENGAGKSTLLKIMAGVLSYDSGLRTIGYKVSTCYFSQHASESLNDNDTIIQAISLPIKDNYDYNENFVRTMAGVFMFSGDDQFKRISVLSGGEKKRVALAAMLIKPANILFLDEPTNHLDPESAKVVIKALKDFEGTLVFISHDKELLHQVPTRVFHIENGKVSDYCGNFEYYLFKHQKADTFANATINSSDKIVPPLSPALERREMVKQLRRIQNQIEKLEKNISELEQKISLKKEELVSEELIRNYTEWEKSHKECNDLEKALESITYTWLQKTEELEKQKQSILDKGFQL